MATWRIDGTARVTQGVCQHLGLMHRNVRAVVEAGRALGVDIHPREFPDGTRSAADAAVASGVDLGQIVKSLVFAVDGEAVIALVSGDNLLDEAKLAEVA